MRSRNALRVTFPSEISQASDCDREQRSIASSLRHGQSLGGDLEGDPAIRIMTIRIEAEAKPGQAIRTRAVEVTLQSG